jgi:hypothetical protein
MARKVPLKERAFSPVKFGLVHAVVSQGANRTSPLVTRFTTKEDVRENPQRPPGERGKRTVEPAIRQLSDKLTREKRVLLSASEESALDGLVHRLAASGVTAVKLSHLMRACIVILRHSEAELIEHVSLSARLVRPPNGSGILLGEFERRLAQQVAAAIRAAPPLG